MQNPHQNTPAPAWHVIEAGDKNTHTHTHPICKVCFEDKIGGSCYAVAVKMQPVTVNKRSETNKLFNLASDHFIKLLSLYENHAFILPSL